MSPSFKEEKKETTVNTRPETEGANVEEQEGLPSGQNKIKLFNGGTEIRTRELTLEDELKMKSLDKHPEENVNPHGEKLVQKELYVGDYRNGNYIKIDSTGALSMVGTSGIAMPHMMQSDSTDQAIANITAQQVITFDTDVHHFEITRTSSSRFTIQRAGSYLICFSGVTLGVVNEYIHVWLRINGNDVANSNTIYQYKSNNATAIVAVSFIEHFAKDDYFEFWTWGTNVGNKWDATAAVAAPGVVRPACPSIIMTCNYVGSD